MGEGEKTICEVEALVSHTNTASFILAYSNFPGNASRLRFLLQLAGHDRNRPWDGTR
jgi:hypothetical protein